MTTWSEVEGEYIEDRIAIREIGNQLYSDDTRRRSHATCYNLHRNAGGSWDSFLKDGKCEFPREQKRGT